MRLTRLAVVLTILLAPVGVIAQEHVYPARGLDYCQLPGMAASASSELSDYPAISAFQGDRVGDVLSIVSSTSRAWGRGGGWNDSTYNSFPDWLRCDFARPASVGRIVVTTFQDNFSTHRIEPYLGLQVGLNYTIEDFDVYVLDMHDNWIEVAEVEENDDIIREFTFEPITGKAVKLVVNDSYGGYSRVISFEAYGK